MRSPVAIKILLGYQDYGQALGEESQARWNRKLDSIAIRSMWLTLIFGEPRVSALTRAPNRAERFVLLRNFC